MPDPLQELQVAAVRLVSHAVPGVAPRKVVVVDESGQAIIDVRIPPMPASIVAPEVVPGWDFSRKVPRFDGVEYPSIAGRSLAVLRVLAEADGPVSVEELRAAWPDYQPAEKSIRNQVDMLRKLLRQLWPEWEGDIISATGAGFRLELR